MVKLTNPAIAIAEDFQALEKQHRLELLLDFANELPELPTRYADHPDLLERVEECQSPVYLFVEVVDGLVQLFLTAPKEAPTTRAFASILHTALDQQTIEDVLNFDDDFPSMLSLTELVSPLRMRGIRGMLARIKRQVSEKQ
ncbi:MAG: SufE family protein [Rhodoluna sp.]|nr:SufE family protein [Rhodoluna sp.]MBP6186226.1 SufE family protein [Rhodoluna sp.]